MIWRRVGLPKTVLPKVTKSDITPIAEINFLTKRRIAENFVITLVRLQPVSFRIVSNAPGDFFLKFN